MKGVMRFEKNGKLSSHYVGSFEILVKVGLVTYWLALPPAISRIYNVFHISMLRKYILKPFYILDYEPLQLKRNLLYEETTIWIVDCKDQMVRCEAPKFCLKFDRA